MQSITVKTFASVSQLLGFAKADVACDGPLPLRVVLAELRSRYPLFSKYLSQVGDEVNLVISCAGRELQLDSLVQPGDELLLLTPIAGG
jgi:molybdopterin converting factor small subunit